MAVVASLHIYPVKSCRGIDLEVATLGRAGLESQGAGDREWMVVDGNGRFLTQREVTHMALIAPALDAGALVLRAPGMQALHVPLDLPFGRTATLEVLVWNHACRALDEGAEAAHWLSQYLGRKVRLARFDPAHKRASNRQRTGATEALNRFSDGYPMLMVSRASLDDLNNRLQENGREALPMNRFRPNIVIDDVGPFDEDRLVSLTAGEIVLKPVKPCPRCPIPSIDQDTGMRGPDPLDILARYRDDPALGVIFGQNTIAASGVGTMLRIGQQFETEWNF